MRVGFAVAWMLVVSSICCGAQSSSRNQHAKEDPAQEQTSFGAEGAFKRPVPVPAAPLKALQEAIGADHDLQMCAEEAGIRVGEIPATWFAASRIQLSREPSSGLVVRGENACLGGAHIAQFWVLARSAGEYKVMFAGRADALRVLPTRSNGYRDLQLVFITQAGRYIDYVKLRFANGGYRKSGHRLTHPN